MISNSPTHVPNIKDEALRHLSLEFIRKELNVSREVFRNALKEMHAVIAEARAYLANARPHERK
ncbi:MAG: hypothetical protein J7527_03010 [Chitinophagaceae bacterium]|nr:hypothetical protein [Chitinophagaceae bacterium]